jgi:predicted GNAT family acetyltransferase
MGSPYVQYRMDSLSALKRGPSWPVSRLDWHADLAMVRRFYARFGKAVDPDAFGPHVGKPLAVVRDGEIVSLAIPLSFREGETEIGGVATVPERRNEGCCKALIAEMAFGILEEGKAAALTTEKDNLPMQRAAEGIGMTRCEGNA